MKGNFFAGVFKAFKEKYGKTLVSSLGITLLDEKE